MLRSQYYPPIIPTIIYLYRNRRLRFRASKSFHPPPSLRFSSLFLSLQTPRCWHSKTLTFPPSLPPTPRSFDSRELLRRIVFQSLPHLGLEQVAASAMVVQSTIGGGRSRQAVPAPKERVGDRSDAGIVGGIKETSTDVGQSAHKLLGRDLFHEVKDRMDQEKESTGSKGFADVQKQLLGYRGFADARKHVNYNAQWMRSHNSSLNDSRRGGYLRNSVSGISKEFRVVKDNRLNQNAKGEVREVKTEESHSGSDKKLSSVPDKIGASDQTDRDSDGYLQSVGPSEEVSKAKNADSGASRKVVVEATQATITISKGRSSDSNSMSHSNASSSNSVIGVYSSFSDPVHVPSPISRNSGKVGAIRREIGVVGGRRQSSDNSVNHSSISSSSFSTSVSQKDISLEARPSSQSVSTSKGNLPEQTALQVPILHNATSSKSIQGYYHNSKLHQSSGFHQKVTQSNMEWKPKSVQKATNAHNVVCGKDSTTNDDCCSSYAVVTSELCEKFSQVSTARNLHVIIPQHLQVPDLERLKLTFGSFGAELDSTDELSSASQQDGKMKPLADGPSASTLASEMDTIAFSMDSFVADHGVILNDQARPFQLGSSASAAGSEELGPGVNENITSENIERYDEIGLVQSNSPPYNSSKVLQYQNNPSFPNFSAYDNQPSYDASSFTTAFADSAFMNGSSSEVLRSHAASSSPALTMVLTQQEHPVQQQQPVSQLYPQVHIPQYPNFVPFRQFFSPVYVPPMAVSNYSGNPAYSHPSTGNSYLVMPGGGSHINAGSMKYPNSQYKPAASGSPTAYGRYSNPTGFTITPGAVGTVTGLEDMTRHKFKDNNLYVPNPQVETSDMNWMQSPQELTSLQSSYYNLPGQAPHVGFMPAHAGHAAFSAAAQPSHQQYPGLYHTQHPPSMASPHHMMHQHLPPSLGGGIGVGVAAPGPQVGGYQQPQVGHFNWTTNF